MCAKYTALQYKTKVLIFFGDIFRTKYLLNVTKLHIYLYNTKRVHRNCLTSTIRTTLDPFILLVTQKLKSGFEKRQKTHLGKYMSHSYKIEKDYGTDTNNDYIYLRIQQL